jgi:hypothetical protein
VYYSPPALPRPSASHGAFATFVGFFNPASQENLCLLKAFIAAPLFFVHGIPRPSWIIDSEDGPGTGKTTLAEVVSQLYGSAPIQCQKYELRQDMTDLVKRLVSSEGRQARMFLIDNVTGEFRSEELSGLITRTDITGRAPYGHGEETRPNNLTYVITANTATIDNDLSVRSFHLFLRKAETSAAWKDQLLTFVNEHRHQIFADIIDILSKHVPFAFDDGTVIAPTTRFPEFETKILQPFCGDIDGYSAVTKALADRRSDANIEEEQARQIEETLRYELVEIGINPDEEAVFLRTAVVEDWIQKAFSSRQSNPVQLIRNLSKSGLLHNIDPKIKRWPHHGTSRRSGIMWQPSPELKATRIVLKHGRDITVRLEA